MNENFPSPIYAYTNGLLMALVPPAHPDGPVQIFSEGRRLDKFLDSDEWQRFSPQCQSCHFDCRFCSQPVVSFQVSERVIMTCRCTILASSHLRNLPQSVEEWDKWQEIYVREMTNPVPLRAMQEGALSGKLPSLASDWLARKLGLPEGIIFHSDGSISSDDQQMLASSCAQAICATVDSENPQNIQKLAGITQHMLDTGWVPEYITISGHDPDYMWPAGTNKESISTLPFRCHQCGKRVKSASLAWPHHDRVYSCLCHNVMLRRDIGNLGDAQAWQALLQQESLGRIQHQGKGPDAAKN